MAFVDTKVNIEYTTQSTINNVPADQVLHDITMACHEGIDEIFYVRDMIDNNGDENIPNTVETWRNNAEYLESILYKILNLLGE